jgi:hypothetical protein
MRLLLFIALIFIAPLLQAQEDEMDLGSIMNSVADGIKPEAYKGKFADDLSDWKEASKGIDGLDAGIFRSQLGGLIGGLKGKAFDGISKGDLLKQLAGVNGLAGMKDVLGSLISGLNPDMLMDAFKGNKDKILGALNKL